MADKAGQPGGRNANVMYPDRQNTLAWYLGNTPQPPSLRHHTQPSKEFNSFSSPLLLCCRPLPAPFLCQTATSTSTSWLDQLIAHTCLRLRAGAMNVIQQRCRPKHQVLVLKCYPRTTKGAVDVKPNSSELSYLLFYATSRRSKIQKVGGFLEKKTASDVWRQRIGNVQVTLQILAALIEKAPKDLPLFAPYVLKILELVLRSDDITMVESSLPTFATFCENHDASSLLADQTYLQQYQSVVRTYASFASTRQSPGKTTPTKPVAMRWRNAGLDAIKSIASSDSLASVSALQLDVIIPMILENLWTDDDMLEVLQQRSQTEKSDVDRLMKRRTSIATVRTVETAVDPNPLALAGSALDVDRLAEEDIGVLAMQCLKQVFIVPSRSQIHGATAALLKFIEERLEQHEVVVRRNERTGVDSGWAIKIFDLVSRWSPVQDRFMILVTAMETLMLTPLNEDTLQQHLALTAMIGSLLRSDVNMIGLSVMDVLLGLIQQMKRLIHLPTSRLDMTDQSGEENDRSPSAVEAAETLSAQRKELLNRLQRCVGDLATHVYYADQITDMISSILLRLKHSSSHSTANSSPTGENADGPSNGMSSTTNLQDSQSLETFFSANIAKIAALQAIKSILLVANPTTKMSGNVNLSRNRVPMFVWEGTHWLLRDPDGLVRKAYADALVTWMERETTVADLKAHDDHAAAHRNSPRNGRDANAAIAARRAASSASAREKPGKLPRSHFLQLLHLAIYDNALQYVDFETDILLLHVLLTKLTMRFGVNAARHGLPMVFRLQEDIQEAETPLSKVRIGGLCHGYFWGLTEVFDFESSVVGRAIHNEIVRRRSKNFWVEGINVPPLPLELVGTPGMQRPQPKMPLREIQSESLLPFDDRISLVECIATGYQNSTVSPPTSPAGSPGRTFTYPINSNLSAVPTIEADQELPTKMREEMLAFEWSRESVISMIQESSKSASLNGSRSGTIGTNRHLLAINGGYTNGHSPVSPSSPVHSAHNLRPGSRQDHTSPMALHKLRKSSVQSAASHSRGSVSSRGYITSIDQLKLVLAGGPVPPPALTNEPAHDDSSDSMASCEFTPSELSFNPAPAEQAEAASAPVGGLTRSGTISSRKGSMGESLGPLNSNPPTESGPILHQEDAKEEEVVVQEERVPPVPPLPPTLTPKKQPSTKSRPATSISVRDHVPKSSRRSLKSRGGDSVQYKNAFTEVPVPTMDLQALLKGIDSHAGEGSIGNITRPPY